MRILLIEDDEKAAAYLVKGLRESGYVVDHAATGNDGLFLASTESYDAMIVDRMLPGIDGLSIIEIVRKSGVSTPVLILSALDKVDDRVTGLKAGGDDYLVARLGDAGGIDAGFTTSQDGQPLTVVTITVDDLAGYMARVILAGGEIVVPRFTIPGVGHACYFTDPTGMIVGLHEPDEDAQ